MYSWEAIQSHVARRLSEESGVEVTVQDLVPPPKPDLGDIAFGCFKIAKAQGKNPAEIAKELEAKMKQGDLTIETVQATGPYLNVVIKTGDLISRIVKDVEGDGRDFAANQDGKGKEVLLEYAQPNTHKEIHVGHSRNLVLGVALVNILRANGWLTKPLSYHGDVGAHVSKCLWLFVRIHSAIVPQPVEPKPKKGVKPAIPLTPDQWTEWVLANLNLEIAQEILSAIPKEDRNGKYLGKMYAESTKLLEENPDWKEQVSMVQQKLESADAAWTALWAETRRWSADEMGTIFQEFGVELDRQYFESEVVTEGQRIVDELLAKKIARESQGAMVVDLEEEKLGVFLIRKSDGTSLYATKDLALAQLKAREYPKAARSLILVDNRQSLYFKQLFRTLELMGLKIPHEFVGYEFVTLKTGAMSSREGNVVTLESFRDEVMAYAKRETKQRHEDWPEGRLAHTAWCLAIGGIKFGMLKQDSDKIFVFDLERALAFDGETGPYVQYAATRLRTILRKAKWKPEDTKACDLTALEHPCEKQLMLQVAALPGTIRQAATELRPALIAQWCVAMAHRSNDFYRDVQVIDAPFGVKQARLRLVAAVVTAFERGLGLLGIPLPDEM